MKIKKFKEIQNLDESSNTEISGLKRLPSNIRSRQEQDFYNYYTKQKFRGLSKYELNKKVWEIAQRNDEIGILAQFCLQIERESIASDDDIINNISSIERDSITNDITKIEDI
jgi:hypothetical protein